MTAKAMGDIPTTMGVPGWLFELRIVCSHVERLPFGVTAMSNG